MSVNLLHDFSQVVENILRSLAFVSKLFRCTLTIISSVKFRNHFIAMLQDTCLESKLSWQTLFILLISLLYIFNSWMTRSLLLTARAKMLQICLDVIYTISFETFSKTTLHQYFTDDCNQWMQFIQDSSLTKWSTLATINSWTPKFVFCYF